MSLVLNIKQQGTKARLNIVGDISEWTNSARDFSNSFKEVIDTGIDSLEVYINSFGGSVFEANEIVNIILTFSGHVDFILGSVCASAATLVVTQVMSEKENVNVSMYKNGQYMIHNVSASVSGQIKDFESAIQLMKNFENAAIDNYAKITGLAKTVIRNMMDKETWMSAQQALDKGFITEIIQKNDNQPKSFATDILNCGYVNPPNFKIENHKIKTEAMTLEQINQLTGKGFTNEADALAYFANLVAENARLRAENEQRVQQQVQTENARIVQQGIDDGKILPGQKEIYIDMLNKAPESTKTLIENLPKIQPLSGSVISKSAFNTKKQQETRTYRELAESDHGTLKDLFENNYDEFNRLFKAEYGYDYKR